MATLTNAEHDVEQFAAAVLAWFESEERSFAWGSRQTGIAESTLAYQLKNPKALSLRVAKALSALTGIPTDRAVA